MTDNDSLIGLQNPTFKNTNGNIESMIKLAQDEKLQMANLAPSLKPEVKQEVTKESPTFDTANEEKERQRILLRLDRLSSTGKMHISYKHDDSLKELRRKQAGAKLIGKAKFCVQMMKRGIVFFAKIAEKLSAEYPNEYLDLEGYSDHLYKRIDDYNEMLHDVFEYYSDSFVHLNPIVTIVMSLGSNMAMYSMTRGMSRMRERIVNAQRDKQLKRKQEFDYRREQIKRHKPSSGDMSGPDTDTESVATRRDYDTVASKDFNTVASMKTNAEITTKEVPNVEPTPSPQTSAEPQSKPVEPVNAKKMAIDLQSLVSS